MIFYDLKKEAVRKSIGNVAAREVELRRIARTLQRQYNSNVLIRGASGTGKTALVEGFAYRAAAGLLPGFEDIPIVKLDTAELKRLATAADAVQQLNAAFSRMPQHTIAVIDDFQNIVPEHRMFEIAQAFEPFFSASAISLAITMDDRAYRQLASQHPTFFQNFEDIDLAESDAAETSTILHALSPAFSAQYGIAVPAAAVQRAADLSARMGGDKRQPLRAMHLLDEALALSKTVGDAALTAETVDKVFSERTGIPDAHAEQRGSSQNSLGTELEDQLNSRVIGQPEAVRAVASTIRRSRMGLRSKDRPYGSFLFLGPSGVGKTELSRVLASLVYGSERAFTRIDMSEFAEPHSVQRLIGAPPGYVGYEAGGQLTNAIRQQPYSLILLDEIEKAHPRVFDIFLQVLEDGRLTDGQGKTVQFTSSTLIATSNIGIDEIVAAFEAGTSATPDSLMPLLLAHFRTEFLNRFDAIVVFNPLGEDALVKVAELEIAKVEARTAEHGVKFNIDPVLLRTKIAELADPRMGARPVKRFIEQTCEGLVALKIMEERGIHP